ncbi:hypothetical protein I3271_07435 [Photobacterium leiognathi]|uniref:hypothetical protein n=1 Tax=Photobacterium leiognathi TaxID=553611 RepID=UPI001EDDB34F|nr:hypothetical protein [Photobacterium leiognathi]MCG3884518.1 hypothetical protein [Photobacterium leiognathi]
MSSMFNINNMRVKFTGSTNNVTTSDFLIEGVSNEQFFDDLPLLSDKIFLYESDAHDELFSSVDNRGFGCVAVISDRPLLKKENTAIELAKERLVQRKMELNDFQRGIVDRALSITVRGKRCISCGKHVSPRSAKPYLIQLRNKLVIDGLNSIDVTSCPNCRCGGGFLFSKGEHTKIKKYLSQIKVAEGRLNALCDERVCRLLDFKLKRPSIILKIITPVNVLNINSERERINRVASVFSRFKDHSAYRK